MRKKNSSPSKNPPLHIKRRESLLWFNQGGSPWFNISKDAMSLGLRFCYSVAILDPMISYGGDVHVYATLCRYGMCFFIPFLHKAGLHQGSCFCVIAGPAAYTLKE